MTCRFSPIMTGAFDLDALSDRLVEGTNAGLLLLTDRERRAEMLPDLDHVHERPKQAPVRTADSFRDWCAGCLEPLMQSLSLAPDPGLAVNDVGNLLLRRRFPFVFLRQGDSYPAFDRLVHALKWLADHGEAIVRVHEAASP